MANTYYQPTYAFTPDTRAIGEQVAYEFSALEVAFDSIQASFTRRVELPDTFTGANRIQDQAVENRLLWIDANGDMALRDISQFDADVAQVAADAISADNDATTATTQAGISTAQATISTGQAVISTAQAVISTAQAGLSADQVALAADEVALATLETSYATQWADKAEDSPITVAAGGDGATTFSARHWAEKAADSAAGLVFDDLIESDSFGWTSEKIAAELKKQQVNLATLLKFGAATW